MKEPICEDCGGPLAPGTEVSAEDHLSFAFFCSMECAERHTFKEENKVFNAAIH